MKKALLIISSVLAAILLIVIGFLLDGGAIYFAAALVCVVPALIFSYKCTGKTTYGARSEKNHSEVIMENAKNEIEVYYVNRKAAGVMQAVLIPVLILVDCFLAVASLGGLLSIKEDIGALWGFLLFFAMLVGFIFLTRFGIKTVRRIKWFLITVNGNTVTMRDKRNNAFSADVSDIRQIERKFKRSGDTKGGRGMWHGQLVIKTADRDFTVPCHYMNGYEQFLYFLKENLSKAESAEAFGENAVELGKFLDIDENDVYRFEENCREQKQYGFPYKIKLVYDVYTGGFGAEYAWEATPEINEIIRKWEKSLFSGKRKTKENKPIEE